MFVGYVLNHEGNVYRMLNPDTRRVHITHDNTWRKRMFFKNRSPLENYTSKLLLINEDGEIEIIGNNNKISTGGQVENENTIQDGSYKNTSRN